MRWLVFAALAACTHPKDPVSELEDPSTCMQCHPQHYTQWSGSMHAYASDDPVFVAMHARGQRETGGQLGTFCVQCHAPMAVVLGIVDDTNAASFDPTALPATARGITCYFCHDVKSVAADHNNGLVLALDQTMRGGAPNPAETPAHDSLYDTTIISGDNNNSSMCGSCHDVVTPSPPSPASVALERTYQEWQTTFFSAPNDPLHHLSCGNCHMVASRDVIAQGPGLNVSTRDNGYHDHFFPGIDQALTPWPQMDTMATEIASILNPAVNITGATPITGPPIPGGICVVPLGGGEITVRMDSQSVGHRWPSGASQDRRAWLEVIAYDASNNVLFQSGIVPDGMDPEDVADPNLFGLWDRIFKSDGTPAHFFWEVATEDIELLKAPVTLDPNDPAFDHSSTKVFPIGALSAQVDHITARILIRPLNLALMNLLVQSGDLDASLPSQLQTLVTGTGGTPFRTWTRANQDGATGCCPVGMPSC